MRWSMKGQDNPNKFPNCSLSFSESSHVWSKTCFLDAKKKKKRTGIRGPCSNPNSGRRSKLVQCVWLLWVCVKLLKSFWKKKNSHQIYIFEYRGRGTDTKNDDEDDLMTNNGNWKKEEKNSVLPLCEGLVLTFKLLLLTETINGLKPLCM